MIKTHEGGWIMVGKLRLDPSINVVSVVVILLTGLGVYVGWEKRMVVVEERTISAPKQELERSNEIKNSVLELRLDVRELRRSIEETNRALIDHDNKQSSFERREDSRRDKRNQQ